MSAVLLGKLEKRAGLEMVRQETPELCRGMKVRSSVKKLCDGCMVGPVCFFEGWIRANGMCLDVEC